MVAKLTSRRVGGAIVLTLMMLLASLGSLGAGAERWAAPGPRDLPPERSTTPAEPGSPTITSIDSPNPTCYRAALGSDVCYINWRSMTVSAISPQRIVSMSVSIDGRVRANYQGFFQSSMDVSRAFHGEGFRVDCGPEGVDGIEGMGRQHDWAIRARDTEDAEATNRGTVTCPALAPFAVSLPMLRR
jgi:hypothetical protein